MKFLLGVGLLSIAVCLLILFDVTQAYSVNETCNTKTCKKIAQIYSASINRSADPCDDFYSYTCGALEFDDNDNRTVSLEDNIIPTLRPDRGEMNKILRLISKFNIDKSATRDEIMDKTPGYFSKNEPKGSVSLQRLKAIATRCKNSSRSADHQSFLDILSKLGFNLEQNNGHWNQTGQFDWINTTEILLDNHFEPNFFFEMVYRAKKPRMMVTPNGDLDIAWESTGDGELTLTKNYVPKFLSDFGQFTLNDTDIDNFYDEIFRELLDFMEKLDQISTDRLYSPKILTIQNLSMISPSIPWLPFFQIAVSSMADRAVDENIRIIIHSLEFIQDFDKLISNTPGNVLLNWVVFIVWNLFRETMSDEVNNYIIDLNPFDEMILTLILADTLTLEEKSMREYIKNLAENIRHEFLDVVNHEWHWLEEATKQKTIKKLESMPVVVVHREITANGEELVHEYESLVLEGPSCWSIVRQTNKFELKRRIMRLLRHKDWRISRMNFDDPPYKSEKYTQLIEDRNIIYISLTGLRNYHVTDQPEYLNLVTVGWDIAQIMAWLLIKDKTVGDNEIWNKVHEAKRCFIAQYNNYTSGKLINYDRETDKITSLNIGLDIMHRLYLKSLNTTETLQWKLPNHNETLDQMFFISAAFQHCRDKRFDIRPRYGFQSVGQNFAEFSEAFSCVEGTTMNPETKCKV